jgi:exodeoxyribonuclease III
MLIVSWNVAGLSTTVNRIYESYGKSSKKKPSVVLSEYFERHGADIVCIQEHKIPFSQLSSRSEPLNCSSIENYESFWSCCVDSKKKGLNGVVTYVKKGVGVVSANSSPLGSADLDQQGRCIMTDHGKFVLFNVYVPASSGQPLSYKMKFLNALRRAMNQQRKDQKHVILVGDLNIAHSKLDIFWSDRVLFINDIQREVLSSSTESLPKWKEELAKVWPKIEAALQTKDVVSTQTTNSLTNQKYNKYRMTAQVDGKKIYLGSHESNPRYCEYCYNFESWKYICSDTEAAILAEEENVVCVSVSYIIDSVDAITC